MKKQQVFIAGLLFASLICPIWQEHTNIIKVLLQKGVRRDFKDSSGKTALDYSQTIGNYELIRILKSN